MLDPLTSFGLASNIVQLIDFGVRLTAEIKACVDSKSDSLPYNAKILELLEEYRCLEKDFKTHYDKVSYDTREKSTVDSLRALREEIDALSAELGELKLEPSPKRLKRTVNAAIRTAQTVWKKDVLEAHQKRLAELTNILGANMLRSLSQRTDSALAKLSADLEDHGIKSSQAITDLKQQTLLLISNCQEQELQRRRRAILDSLRFSSMEERRRIISDNHPKTYDWCFKDSNLSEWLEHGSGIFWVRGLAGSGKSTFMKFLVHDERTTWCLKKWAKHHSLITADHYFWYAGTYMEKCHLGLLQSLLLQVLQADEDMASLLCNDRLVGTVADRSKAWPRKELTCALQRLDLAQHIRVCIFIDGLDEYLPQDEHDKLISELHALANMSNIKICVSSRPWEQFEDAFGSRAMHLRLEPLTIEDIRTYTRDHLKTASMKYRKYIEDCNEADTERLAAAVASKAKGVFLWVYLVVSALKEHMRGLNAVDRLYKCIDSFPETLEEYFRKFIYERIEPSLRADTAQVLRLAWLIRQHGDQYSKKQVLLDSFLPFWIQRSGVRDKSFALAGELQLKPHMELHKTVNIIRAYLNACCKDLLWVSVMHEHGDEVADDCSADDYTVHFLHRTVYDFLKTSEMNNILERFLPEHFQDGAFLIHVTIACLKVHFKDPRHGHKEYPFERFQDAIASVLPDFRTVVSTKTTPAEQTTSAIEKLSCQYSETFYDKSDSRFEERFMSIGFLQRLVVCESYICTTRWLRYMHKKYGSSGIHYCSPLFRAMSITFGTAPPLLFAALGLWEQRPFSIEHINEGFIREALVSGNRPNATVSSSSSHSPSRSTWFLYLQKWLNETCHTCEYENTMSDDIRASCKGWSVAKLLIDYNDNFAACLYSEYRNPLDPDCPLSVSEALRFCVPERLQPELTAALDTKGVKG